MAQQGIQRKRKWDQPGVLPATYAQVAATTVMLSNKGVLKGDEPDVFTMDYDINNVGNRHILTKRETHDRIKEETGAALVVRGRFKPPGASDPAPSERPLFLHVTAETQEALNNAATLIRKITEMGAAAFGGGNGGRIAAAEPHNTSSGSRYPSPRAPGGRQQCTIYMGIENEPVFKLKQRLVGTKGAYLKYITMLTGARVQIRGLTSGHLEPPYNQEAPEPLHLHVTCNSAEGFREARTLVESLVETVRQDYREWHTKFGVTPPILPDLYNPHAISHRDGATKNKISLSIIIGQAPHSGQEGQHGNWRQ